MPTYLDYAHNMPYNMSSMNSLYKQDPKIAKIIASEEIRQSEQLRLIPSENYTSKAVREAVGSILMNKYSEGQAHKRYYQGNSNIDAIEDTVKSRALKLFGLDPDLWHVNVQAVTGSYANFAAYATLINLGDTIMGMHLYHGGHLSHGWQTESGKPISFTAKLYNSVHYFVDKNSQVFNYDDVESVAKEHNPAILISGGTAYPREIDHQKMAKIAKNSGAFYMADIAHEAGLVAADVNQSPFPHADIVTMTTRKTLRGPIGALVFIKKDRGEDLDRTIFPGLQGGPQNHSIAGIGVALKEAMQPEFKNYAKQVILNARILASELADKGYNIVSGGTDKHLLLIDLRDKNITGTQAAIALEQANIILNKNTVPYDEAKPWNPSGIRLGTPAITTRGMQEKEMKQIAEWIDQVLQNIKDEKQIKQVAEEVLTLTKKFGTP